jgi:ATP-dependent DNA helicase RecQ
MALHYPIDEEELKHISGVGEGKVKKFGKDFIDIIKKYVEDQGISKDESFFVKSVPNKSINKVAIIQATDRKLPLEDIAKGKGVDMLGLITEIEQIVRSGTKINLDYHISEILDEDQTEEIFEYFMEAESENIQGAFEEFDGEYDEEELRLVMIKFLSEVAN